jgi:hypothetical protein
MSFQTQYTTVGTTAIAIAVLPVSMGQSKAIQVFNNDSAAIFVGASNVTATGATKGRTVGAGANYQIWVNGGDVIYAVSAAGTTTGAVVVQYSA